MTVLYRSRLARTAAGAVLCLVATTLSLATAEPAQAALIVRVVNTAGDGVASRSEPRTADRDGYGAPEGATVTAHCWTWGDAVGPYANRLWWSIEYQSRRFYAADRYLSTPNRANEPPAGQPQCGASPPPTTTPTTGEAPAVWVGAPFAGTWVPIDSDCPPRVRPNDECSMPAYHHFLDTRNAPLADWSVDLGAAAGTPVKVYAAPRDSRVAVKAVVERVRPTCRSQSLADGGWAVTVAFHAAGKRVGSATYGHLEPAVKEGQPLNRWGGRVGTVGHYSRGGCWQGDHLHFQMESTKNYACYRGNIANRTAIRPTNFLGYTGGSFARAVRRPCP